MNKIFKVVWSKSKSCYVVVSEFAKNNSGKKKIVVAAILAALAMTNASISMAANTLPTKLHATAVGLGDGASVTGDKAVGFGQNAAAAGGYSIAIGSNSSTSVNSPQGIAIGGGNTANEGARVIGEQAIAIGGNTIAQGNSSIVIGGDDVVKADGVKVIYTTNNGEIQTGDLRSAVQSLTGFDMRNPLYTTATAGESGITLGMKGQSGNVGIAIGTGANAKDRLSGPSGQANNDVTNAIAIGTGARANRDNAIAIGGGSNTDVGGTKQSSYTLPNNVVASWAGGDKTLPGDVVSFGSKGYERQLKHVAPGEVSATSTDAINGSQLSAIVDQIAYKYISIKSSDAANKDNTGATADNSIAIGPNAATDASASRSVAVGDGARGKVVDGVAVGSKSIADIASGVAGYNVNASRTDIYAGLSGAALTSKLGGVAVGTINQTRQINYVAAGTADTDAVNVAQLKSVNLAFTGDTGTGDVNLANSKLAVNGDNTYISTTANGKKITVSGKKQDITVANGSATATAGMADSANVANAINQAIDQNKYGWNLSANGEATPVAVEKGNTVDFSGDDNVAVARNDKKISVALKKDLSKLNSASFNNASGNETVKIDGDKGINAGNLKVANVADGVADKDAVNVSQLKKVDDKAEANKTAIGTNKTAIAKNVGDIATNKTDIATNKDSIAANTQKIVDNKTAIDKNTGEIATNKANIAQNTAAIARKISLGGNSGSTDEKSLSTGDVKFNVKGENGLTTVANGDDVTVKLDDATKGKVDNAADRDLSNLTPDGKQQVKDLAAWNVVANNETAEKVVGGNTVKFIDGDNISITQNGKDFTISTKKDVTFDTVTAIQTITAPKVKATTGVETPQVTGLTNTAWVPGQTQPVSGRAATEDQLKQVDDQVADNKANIADNTDKIGKNADAIADNKQKIADNKTAIDKNIGDIATNKADIATNKANIDKNMTAIARKISLGGNSGSTDEKSLSTGDVKFNVKGENGLTTVANGDDVTVKLDDATKGKVDNAADRDLSNLTDAGKQQVKDLAAWHVVANNETAEKVEGGNTVKFIDGDNISITQNGKDFTISTKKDVTFDTVTATQTITAPKVKATTGVETPQVTGLTNTAWTPGQTQPVSGRAATEDQLKHVDDQVAENKANIADNTDKIGKNADAIADNKQKIADNKTAIDKNAVDIATNKDNIATNKADIAANTDKIGKNADAIADNKQKIADNKTAIDKNTGDIATNKGDIAANKQKIADNKTAIDKNTGDIATNKADIATNKDNIATNKANIDKNTTAIGRKISLGGNSGSTDEKSLSTGDVKFNVKGENGLTTVANGDDVTVKLDDATKSKVDNAADRDLSNLTPDGKQQIKDLAAWNVVANNETAEKVEGGNTVKFIDGDNISITQNGKDFTISTKKDVTFDTVTATQTITAPKVKATTGVETPQVTGLTNIAWVSGQTQPVSGRAATEDQLKQVDDQVAENKANIADNTDKIGKNAKAIADNKQKIDDNKAAIDRNAADIATNKDNIATNKQNIADNKAAITKNAGDIATNKANIDKNTEAIGRKISLGGNTGSTDEKSLSTGDVKFNIKGQNGIVTEANGDDVTVKLDDATANKINNAANTDLSNLTDAGKQQVKDLSAWNVVANGNTAEKVEGGNTVKFIDGDNISITQNGKDFTIATKQDVTFNTVKANQTITAPKVKATEGVETPQVTGLTNTAWTPGQTQPVSGRAATEDQLKHVDDQVAENKANIADNIDKIGKNADAIADNKQKIANNKAAIDRNAADIATNKDNIAANKQNIADNKAAITKNTSDIATNKDNIATNKANINKNTTAIARKISLGGNTGSTDEKSLSTGDVKFNVKGENGLTTVANGDDVTVKLDDATKGKIDNAANQDLSNLTDAGKQQVKDISAWKVTAAGGTVEKVQGGDTVKFQAGDNLVVNQDRTTFTYGLAKDLKGLNSVTVGDENGVSTKITPAGTTVKDAAGNSTTINGGGYDYYSGRCSSWSCIPYCRRFK